MTIRLLSYVFVALIAFAGGFLVGNWNTDGSSDSNAGAAANPSDGAMADDSGIPVADSPVLGKEDALITVVEFSDFQCPFCQRGADTVKELQEKYPNDVKVVYKHNPLPMHQQAPDAHKASIAAHNQGKFWEMHDWLFENQKQIKQHGDDMKEWTAGYAEELGLDVEQFKADFDAAETEEIIDRDMELGKKLEVRGTPHFFVNGQRVKGAKPLSEFENIVEEQLEEAKEMIEQGGVARDEVYKKMVEENFDGDLSDSGQKADRGDNKPNQPNKPDQKVEHVPVEDADPKFGNEEDPLVTIVEFSDFQCPFCGKVLPTVDKIKENYGEEVRFVFKQLPLPMHSEAKPAAQAALAADRQGKFWEMHDLLFEKQKEMKQNGGDDFKEWAAGLAQELGMNVDKFKKDFDDPEIAEKVDRDHDLSKEVGARGTPNFWINGINLRGAQPYGRFESIIEEQIELAKEVKDDTGLSGDELYEELVSINEEDAPSPKAEKPERPEKPEAKADVGDLTLEDAPTQGPDDAPVQIIEFSDFQCPYCAKGGDSMREAAEKFGDDVQIVFKNYPLPFHKAGKPAAKAAMAAGEQGKFWEMHELLFENQKQLEKDGLFEDLAEELDLDVAQFKQDMEKDEYDEIIERDMKEGQSVGVRGTPAFFINGKSVTGAQPTHKFEEEIKKALDEG